DVRQVQFIPTDLENTAPLFIDIIVENRADLKQYLIKKQIGSRPFYPPIHTQAPYKKWHEYSDEHFPVSEEISSGGLWLPSASLLTDEAVLRICKVIKKFYSNEK
ncbi:MAG: DegT/DnrJ/EryC1/StrS family aminotransferase, partial [Candidatus Daviesbacteria bacterium]|nr:DegT/DnrJ/EryC1/StrS family aminotransferase [Candidatus Daviesbacteria bacterium]